MEVSLRCDEQYESLGKRVFFSVVPNLFIGSLRFLQQKEKILKFNNSIE
jgi:hypothetical protein